MSTTENKQYKDTPIRWQIWDYSAPAKYFITICTQNRALIFDNIANNNMTLSDAGKIVSDEIEKLPTYHPRIILDEYIVMPNHIHIIIELGDYFFDNGCFGIGVNQNPVSVGQIHEFAPRKRDFKLPAVINQDFVIQEYKKIESAINNANGNINETIIKQYRKLRRCQSRQPK